MISGGKNKNGTLRNCAMEGDVSGISKSGEALGMLG